MLKKEIAWEWNLQQRLLETKIVEAPILRLLDWDRPFHIHVDASLMVIGCVLTQPSDNNVDLPIYFASRKLTPAEQNYSMIEQEDLGMVYALQKFKHYLLANPFSFYVDHQVLKCLINKPILQGRINRWLMLFQEFNFKIIVKRGDKHMIPDVLSREVEGEPATGVPDNFLNT